MSYSFPRLSFDRNRYVSLDQAFQTLGTYLFPTEWNGREIASWPMEAVATLSDTLEELREKAEFSTRGLREVKLEYFGESDAVSRDQLRPLLAKAADAADFDRANLQGFQESYKNRIPDAEAYERKRAVISRLCTSIRNQELVLRIQWGASYSDMRDWMDKPEFRISFQYSFVVTPVRLGRRNKSKAYFEKAEFENWVAPLLPNLDEYRTIAVEDDLVVWFKGLVAVLEPNGGKLSRNAILEKCQSEFPYADRIEKLEKAVGAVWELYAPAYWKKGGKPSNP